VDLGWGRLRRPPTARGALLSRWRCGRALLLLLLLRGRGFLGTDAGHRKRRKNEWECKAQASPYRQGHNHQIPLHPRSTRAKLHIAAPSATTSADQMRVKGILLANAAAALISQESGRQ